MPSPSSFPSLFFSPSLPIGPHYRLLILPQKPRTMRIYMRDRSKNRKPAQKGRYLSSEAIQTVQSLKRFKSTILVDGVVGPKLQRLIKNDMIAVMRELLTQSEPLLALLVFDEIRKEHWYRPQLSLYTDLITNLARSNLKKELEEICAYLKTEYYLETDTEGFDILLEALLEYGFVQLAMDCYRLMKLWECEPDKSTYKILINGLEARGEMDISCSVRLEAAKLFGGSLDFLKEKEEEEIH